MREKMLMQYFYAMQAYYGKVTWWKAKSPFEVFVGAVLTQNTTWHNVELALAHLREQNLLHPEYLANSSLEKLEACIRPAGFWRRKAATLKKLCSFLFSLASEDQALDAHLTCLDSYATEKLRKGLLSVGGIGFETADSILLYGLNRPIFVVDGYTKRIFWRHHLVFDEISYEELQEFFMDVLSNDVDLFKAYHGLIVETAKEFCKKKQALCFGCPLYEFLECSAAE